MTDIPTVTQSAREAAAMYWDRKGVQLLAKSIRAGHADDTIEVQVAAIAYARANALEVAATAYMNAVQDLGEHDPVSKLTYFEESPSQNGECLWRWQQLDATGKALAAALAKAKDQDLPHPPKQRGIA